MKDDPLLSPKLKVERANRHIIDATAQIITFLRTNNELVQILMEPDADGLRQVVRAKLMKAPPHEIAGAVGDAVSNLRAALDHLVRCLAIKNSRDPDGASFPFAGSRQRFEEPGTQGKIAALAPEARLAIAELQPYKASEIEPSSGGNNLLWSLNKVRNSDIHQIVVPLGIAATDIHASVTTRGHLGFNVIEAPKRFRFGKDKTAEIMRVPGNPDDIKSYVKLGLDIGFGDVEVVAGVPVTAVLHDYSNLVSRIIDTFERRFFS